MKRELTTCAALIAGLTLAAATLTGCSTSEPRTAIEPAAANSGVTVVHDDNPFEFWYWPEAQVYFSAQRNQYFWKQNGQVWAAEELPDHLMAKLGGAVVTRLNTPNPFAASLTVAEVTSR